MNYLVQLFITAIILIVSLNTFAAKAIPTECLPLSVVADAKFTKAWRPTNTPEPGFWAMATDPVVYQGKSWSIGFVVLFPYVQTSEEALKKGQDFFKKYVPLSLIKKDIGKVEIWCMYSYSQGNYIVEAESPPVNLPNLKHTS